MQFPVKEEGGQQQISVKFLQNLLKSACKCAKKSILRPQLFSVFSGCRSPGPNLCEGWDAFRYPMGDLIWKLFSCFRCLFVVVHEHLKMPLTYTIVRLVFPNFLRFFF